MEHLALEIFDLSGTGSQYAILPEDSSIAFTETSEIFGSGDIWSQNFRLNVHLNAHIFGTSGELHGSLLHEQIDKRKARIWAEGMPLHLGFLKLGDEADLDSEGNIDVSFESGRKTFENMIDGGRANQVPMLGDVQIGMALWRKRVTKMGVGISCYLNFKDGSVSPVSTNAVSFTEDGEYNPLQQYPRMVFPKGSFIRLGEGGSETTEVVNFLNTDHAYDDAHPFCHISLCYQRQGYEQKDGTPDYSSEPSAQRGYEEMPANRVNSAPNFFVIYWLKALMAHLGIYIEENQMLDVEDLRRLFFVNTKCAYEEPKNLRRAGWDTKYGMYKFQDGRYVAERYNAEELTKPDECGLIVKSYTYDVEKSWEGLPDEVVPKIDKVVVNITGIDNLEESQDRLDQWNWANNRYAHKAFASSACFPDVDISDTINAIKNGFGVRLLFDRSYQRVRIVLLRNVFRSQDVHEVKCDILGTEKVENNVRGFRMTYGKGEDDTSYYYKGFSDKLPRAKELWVDNSDTHDYSKWDLNAKYSDVIMKESAFDNTCYVTPNTGNAYGIKVDKEARRYYELRPAMFEFAGFMDAEDGDCRGEDGSVEEINMGFTPAIMNDLNAKEEKATGNQTQRFSLFVSDTMRPRRFDLGDLVPPKSYNDSDAKYDVWSLWNHTELMNDGIVKPGEFAITSDMFLENIPNQFEFTTGVQYEGAWRLLRWTVDVSMDGYINEGYRLYLQDNYEPNDEGVSPVENHEWGLTLGVLRGVGEGSSVSYYRDADDGEGNQAWSVTPGDSITTHPDICDNYGNLWSYGNQLVISTSEQALQYMHSQWPMSNFSLDTRTSSDFLVFGHIARGVTDDQGRNHTLLFAMTTADRSINFPLREVEDYVNMHLRGKSVSDMFSTDASLWRILIEADTSYERMSTLIQLQKYAYRWSSSLPPVVIDDSETARMGRFSLKLRAEKLNPLFNPRLPEDEFTNRRYLKIEDDRLRQRGLADTFYKEYSYFIRNARIAKRRTRMELMELLMIDKSVWVKVGDVLGLVLQMQYNVSKKNGLGEVTMEIMYI